MKNVLNYGLPMLVLGLAVASSVTYHFMKPGDVRHPITPIEVGTLYRSGQLDPEDLEEAIRTRGIKTVVNLGSEADTDPAVCSRLGVKYMDLPCGDVFTLTGQPAPGQTEKPPAPYDLGPLWEALEDPSRGPVLIHCQGGIHRTGVVAAMYRIRYQGWRPEEAISEVGQFGFNTNKPKVAPVFNYLRQMQSGDRMAEAARWLTHSPYFQNSPRIRKSALPS